MKLTIELEHDADMAEETWVSHCLELDVVSQGATPKQAIEMLAEAVDMMVRDEIVALESSGQIESPGWERAFSNIATEVADRERSSVQSRTVLCDNDIERMSTKKHELEAKLQDSSILERPELESKLHSSVLELVRHTAEKAVDAALNEVRRQLALPVPGEIEHVLSQARVIGLGNAVERDVLAGRIIEQLNRGSAPTLTPEQWGILVPFFRSDGELERRVIRGDEDGRLGAMLEAFETFFAMSRRQLGHDRIPVSFWHDRIPVSFWEACAVVRRRSALVHGKRTDP